MAKGAESKVKVQKQILEAFPGSFLYNDGKEIRVPMSEGGEQVQIKIALTCAKENVEIGADNAVPGDFPAPKMTAPTPVSTAPVQPSTEEKQKVADLLKSLGL
jgi:hypothetical protein